MAGCRTFACVLGMSSSLGVKVPERWAAPRSGGLKFLRRARMRSAVSKSGGNSSLARASAPPTMIRFCQRPPDHPQDFACSRSAQVVVGVGPVGGQFCAQDPLQTDLPAEFFSNV